MFIYECFIFFIIINLDNQCFAANQEKFLKNIDEDGLGRVNNT